MDIDVLDAWSNPVPHGERRDDPMAIPLRMKPGA